MVQGGRIAETESGMREGGRMGRCKWTGARGCRCGFQQSLTHVVPGPRRADTMARLWGRGTREAAGCRARNKWRCARRNFDGVSLEGQERLVGFCCVMEMLTARRQALCTPVLITGSPDGISGHYGDGAMSQCPEQQSPHAFCSKVKESQQPECN